LASLLLVLLLLPAILLLKHLLLQLNLMPAHPLHPLLAAPLPQARLMLQLQHLLPAPLLLVVPLLLPAL
jgi:hypothetical protein